MMRRVLLTLFALALLCTAANAWTIGGDTYAVRYDHQLNGVPGAGTLNYPILNFTVFNTTGDPAENVIYTDGTTQGDWDDVRFTTTSDTVLPCWIESTNATAALFRVNVTQIPEAGATLRIYYDSDTASAASNSAATFPFFDGFDGAALDASKWTTATGLISVSGGAVTVGNNLWETPQGIKSAQTFGTGTALRMRYSVTEPTFTNSFPEVGFSDWGTHQIGTLCFASKYRLVNYNGVQTSSDLANGDTNFHLIDVYWPTATVVRGRVDGGTVVQHTTNIPTGQIPISFRPFTNNGQPVSNIVCDWIFVQPYGATEPTHGAYIDMSLPPTAGFSANVTVGTAPLTVQFTDASTNGPVDWLWSFGDGTYSTAQNPTHVYSTLGTFTVELTASSEAATADSETKAGYITTTQRTYDGVTEASANFPNFTGTPLTGAAPLNVSFTDTTTGTGIAAWAWDYDNDGSVDTVDRAQIGLMNGDGQFFNPARVAVADGYLYVADTGNNRIVKRNATDLTLVSKVGSLGIGDDQFNAPAGIAASADGYLYITDSGNNRIVKRFASNLSYVSQVGSPGTGDNQFNTPYGIAVSADGYLYIADGGNHRIVKRSAADLSYVSKIGSSGSGDDHFSTPRGVAVSSSGYLYVADTGNNRIVNRSAADLSYVAKIGSSGSGDDQFSSPRGVSVSSDGYLYVADRSNHRIVKRLASDLSYVAKIGSSGSGDDQFNGPYGIAASSDGMYLYVADTGNNRIVKRLASDLSYVAKIGSNGAGNDQFSNPGGVAVSSDGMYLYVADIGNNRIVKRLASDLSYVAKIGSSGSGDDQFSGPSGIAVSSDGYLCVLDTSNHRIVKRYASNLSIYRSNPYHDFATGVYDVSLTTTDTANINATTVRYDYIYAGTLHTAALTASDTAVATGETVTFTDASTGVSAEAVTYYTWDFGDGVITHTRNASHIYATPGTRTVTFTVSNGYGNSTDTEQIEAGYAPVAAFSADDTVAATGQTLQFTDASTNTPTAWEWDYGDGTPHGSTQNPTHAYASPGTYSVNLTASNAYGADSEVKTGYITVGDPPTAAFSANDVTPYLGQTVTFTDATTSTPTSWDWDFGDGSPHGTTQNPTHAYSVAGTYTVTLTAANPYASDGETKTGYISTGPAPVAAFSGTPLIGAVPLEVTFTDASTDATAWDWNYGDGSPHGSSQNAVHTYAGVGTFTVILTATNTWGSDGETKTNYITVGVGPVAAFSANDTTPAVDQTVLLTDASTGATSWSWNFGDGSPASNLQNPTHAYDAAGTYTVVQSATNIYGNDLETKTNYITVGIPPTAAFSGTPLIGPVPLEVTFTDASTHSPTSWDWDYGDGSPHGTTQNPAHTYSVAGSYTVVLNSTNTYGSDLETKVAYVDAGTAPTAAFTVNSQTAAAGVALSFTDTSTGTPTAWNWSFGDGNTSALQNPTHAYAAMGTYTVSLNVSNAYGQDLETKVGYIVIDTPPTAAFTAAPIAGAAPLAVQFTDLSTAFPTSWAWDFDGDGTADSTDQNPTHTYAANGNYTVTLQATNAYGQDLETKTDYITVAPLTSTYLKASFTWTAPASGQAPLAVQFTDTTKANGTYARSWNFGDGTSSAEANPLHTYVTAGEYDVSLTVTSDTRTNTERIAKVVKIYPVAAGSPLPTNTYGAKMTQMMDSNWNITVIGALIPTAFTDIMPATLFWGLLFVGVFLILFVRQGTSWLVALLGIIIGGNVLVFLPPEFQALGQVMLIISVGAFLYVLIMGRIRSN